MPCSVACRVFGHRELDKERTFRLIEPTEHLLQMVASHGGATGGRDGIALPRMEENAGPIPGEGLPIMPNDAAEAVNAARRHHILRAVPILGHASRIDDPVVVIRTWVIHSGGPGGHFAVPEAGNSR